MSLVLDNELINHFNWQFDDIHGDIVIAGITFSASNILKELDPIAYNEEFNNWLDKGEHYSDKYEWRF